MYSFIKTSLVSMLAIGLLFSVSNGTMVFAEGTTAQSQTSLDVVTPSNPNKPNPPIVHPSDPGEETGQTGKLTLDLVSGYNFGKTRIKTGETVLTPIVPTNENNESYIKGLQVTDVRASGTGWRVTVSLAPFIGQNDATHTLKGVQLVLPQGKLVTQNTSQVKGAPTANEVILEPDNTSHVIFQAGIDEGMGTWVNLFDPKQVRLIVPTLQKADMYRSRLFWQLSDTPA